MGAIFFWVTGRNPDRLNARSWQFPAVFSQPAAAPGNSTILTPPEASPEVRSPARTIVPSQPDVVAIAPIGPVLPAVPPMGTVVVPQAPIERETVPPVITKPKAAKPKAGPVKLSDVPEKYWARPFIVALVDRKIFTELADNKFRPDEPMTRAELARLIQRIADKEPRRKPVDFKDVKDNSPIAGAIDHSVKTGYLKGYPDNAFRPDKEVPRVEVIASLASGLNLKPSAKPNQTLQVYTDRKKVPKWALNKVAAATEAGIVVNHPKPTLLQPNRTATRAEVAAMIYEAMAKQGKVPVKPSEAVIKPVKPSK
ncbi:MAG: S-layer homology domain-containing protein [Oscillatoriales cyanobacterium]|nr:MAG: S-layer homology domain-containing protein [Oscillatoriales cyanobacterium]TAF55183.1 MAG: S-layer homology domain-containing protein [Oscillatoriales cyanobacterium]